MSPCSTPSPKKRQLPQIPIQAQHTSRDRGKLASFVVYLDSASSYEELLQVKLSTLHLGVLRILAIKLNKSVKIVYQLSDHDTLHHGLASDTLWPSHFQNGNVFFFSEI